MAATDITDQEKVEILNKQIETTSEQEHKRFVRSQSKQKHEFNYKIEDEQILIKEELNQIKSTTSSDEIETQIIVMRRAIEKKPPKRVKHIQRKSETLFCKKGQKNCKYKQIY